MMTYIILFSSDFVTLENKKVVEKIQVTPTYREFVSMRFCFSSIIWNCWRNIFTVRILSKRQETGWIIQIFIPPDHFYWTIYRFVNILNAITCVREMADIKKARSITQSAYSSYTQEETVWTWYVSLKSRALIGPQHFKKHILYINTYLYEISGWNVNLVYDVSCDYL